MAAGPLDSQTGILVVGHGSRELESHGMVLSLCRGVQKRLDTVPVQACYLELDRPTIGEGLAALYRRGIARAIVVPLQLTAGRHVRYDIPGEVGRHLTKMSSLSVCFSEHLGSHPKILEIADARLMAALAGRRRLNGSTKKLPQNYQEGLPRAENNRSSGFGARSKYLFVARGSRDPLVRGEVLQLAEQQRNRGGKNDLAACFLAMTSPTFEDTLREVLSTRPDRIVIQPYLLYPGRLLQHIHRRVAEIGSQYPNIDWIVTGTLGPDEGLVDCVLDLAADVAERHRRRELLVYGDSIPQQETEA